jgi:hypothetical protein
VVHRANNLWGPEKKWLKVTRKKDFIWWVVVKIHNATFGLMTKQMYE